MICRTRAPAGTVYGRHIWGTGFQPVCSAARDAGRYGLDAGLPSGFSSGGGNTPQR